MMVRFHHLIILAQARPVMLCISLVTPGCVRVFIRLFVRPCVRVKDESGSRMHVRAPGPGCTFDL